VRNPRIRRRAADQGNDQDAVVRPTLVHISPSARADKNAGKVGRVRCDGAPLSASAMNVTRRRHSVSECHHRAGARDAS
jgi:hypothetical protein